MAMSAEMGLCRISTHAYKKKNKQKKTEQQQQKKQQQQQKKKKKTTTNKQTTHTHMKTTNSTVQCIILLKENTPKQHHPYTSLRAILFVHRPCHAQTCLMSYANNKGADQHAHPSIAA